MSRREGISTGRETDDIDFRLDLARSLCVVIKESEADEGDIREALWILAEELAVLAQRARTTKLAKREVRAGVKRKAAGR